MPAGATLVEIVQFSVNDLRPTGAIDPAELIALRRGHEAKMYVAFVLSANPGRPVRLVELGDADTIDELIGGFRRWISRGRRRPDTNAPDAGRSLSESGSELRAAVFEPLEQVLGESRQLLIAPDGDLTRLPLEALPDGKGAHLIDRYSITYLSAARDILRFGIKHHRRQSPAVVVADPDFDLRAPHDPSSDFSLLESSDFEFRRLSGTRQEGRLVADVLIDAEELCGHRALESAVKAVRAPKVLHLATHGWFLANRMIDSERVAAEDPLYIHTVHMATIPGFGAYLMDVASAPDPEVELPTHLRRLGANQVNPLLRAGLALAGANTWLRGGHLPTEAEDGLLTAEDVCALDLFGTELVVLSACETGLGEVVSGEGVFGLRRAFVLSGAATLVMSLWKVPDVATASLMADFYRLMQSGVSRGEALRGAQLAMRSRAGYSDPYYWAAFVCQGDPGPISIARSPSAATAT
jgi:CHAT domain-containing protein